MDILTVNVGSSSVRLALYDARGQRRADEHHTDHEASPGALLRQFIAHAGVNENAGKAVAGVAHRIVHGGARFTRSCRIDDAVEAAIEQLAPLAPLHNPRALAWVRAVRQVLPETPQVAVFDTAFFSQLPEQAQTYALPLPLLQKHGLRRYGFHGLAHRSMWQQWQRTRTANGAPGEGRLISLQLGSGCSIAAIRGGEPVDTSMGFSPLEGLVMATRCGELDPGLLLYLQREAGMSAAELERVLNEDSGLQGLAGSPDMRELLAAPSAAAQRAVDVYCYRARKYIGAYLAALDGVDAIAFGGGVGEHLAPIRAQILEGLSFVRIALDPARNAATSGRAGRIDAPGSAAEIHVLPVDEAQILAHEAREVLPGSTASSRPV